jgi:acyl-CoA thioester hydrolase
MRATFDLPTDAAAYRFCHRVRVRFAETDAMGIVHHAAYLPYLEEARVAYLRSVGHPFDEIRSDGYEMPVVEVRARYFRPSRFDEVIAVHLTVASARGATFELAYLLTVGLEVRMTAVTVHAVVGPGGRALRCPAWLVALVA